MIETGLHLYRATSKESSCHLRFSGPSHTLQLNSTRHQRGDMQISAQTNEQNEILVWRQIADLFMRGVLKAEEGAAEEHPALVGVFIFLAMFSRVCLVRPGAHRLGSPPVSPSIPPTCDFQLRAAGASSWGFHFVSWGHLL